MTYYRIFNYIKHAEIKLLISCVMNNIFLKTFFPFLKYKIYYNFNNARLFDSLEEKCKTAINAFAIYKNVTVSQLYMMWRVKLKLNKS